jgi:hypothetical protein
MDDDCEGGGKSQLATPFMVVTMKRALAAADHPSATDGLSYIISSMLSDRPGFFSCR